MVFSIEYNIFYLMAINKSYHSAIKNISLNRQIYKKNNLNIEEMLYLFGKRLKKKGFKLSYKYHQIILVIY